MSINDKYTNIYTLKNIKFQKKPILFIYVRKWHFHAFLIIFKNKQKTHIYKKHHFLKNTIFSKIIIIFIYTFFNIYGKMAILGKWRFSTNSRKCQIWGKLAGAVKNGGPEKTADFFGLKKWPKNRGPKKRPKFEA